MRRVRITLPAAVTGLGPGLDTLGLALNLRLTVEISERQDHQLVVETAGEGAGEYSIGLRHPVVLALIRVFQHFERAPGGLTVHIDNAIPTATGLGAVPAFWLAGIIGGNNLIGSPLKRQDVLELAARAGQPAASLATSMLGGLCTGLMVEDSLLAHTLTAAPLRAILIVPDVADYPTNPADLLPPTYAADAVRFNLERLLPLVEGLRTGNLDTISRTLDDRLHAPCFTPHLPIYDDLRELARRAGGGALTLCGYGPALIAFVKEQHDLIAEAMVVLLRDNDVEARAWIVPIDTQGVVVSISQSG